MKLTSLLVKYWFQKKDYFIRKCQQEHRKINVGAYESRTKADSPARIVAEYAFYKMLKEKLSEMFGSYKKSAYLCRRLAALGNLKASFHCARWHNLCRRFINHGGRIWQIISDLTGR